MGLRGNPAPSRRGTRRPAPHAPGRKDHHALQSTPHRPARRHHSVGRACALLCRGCLVRPAAFAGALSPDQPLWPGTRRLWPISRRAHALRRRNALPPLLRARERARARAHGNLPPFCGAGHRRARRVAGLPHHRARPLCRSWPCRPRPHRPSARGGRERRHGSTRPRSAGTRAPATRLLSVFVVAAENLLVAGLKELWGRRVCACSPPRPRQPSSPGGASPRVSAKPLWQRASPRRSFAPSPAGTPRAPPAPWRSSPYPPCGPASHVGAAASFG